MTTTLDITLECPQCEREVSVLSYNQGLVAVNREGIRSCFKGPLITHLDAVIERLAKAQHDAYEAAAVTAGWQTQTVSRKPWEGVPEANKSTVRASLMTVLTELVSM